MTGILDFTPKWRKHKTWVIGAICIVGILAGMPLTTRVTMTAKCDGLNTSCQIYPFLFKAGGYLVDFFDFYAAGWPLMFLGLMEFILIAHIYGVENFLRDLNQMVGFDPGERLKSHFVCLVSTISPLLLAVSESIMKNFDISDTA